MTVFKSVLVIGPTGAGKSPLGDYIEAKGFLGASAGHFDFGENLRTAVSAPAGAAGLTDDETAIVRNVLSSGALLEDHQFSIVEKLFSAFVASKGLGAADWVLLNGMPRHVGQAEAVASFADVKYVANLVCSEEIVGQRIRSNAGGDRTGRIDDDMAAVRNKLAIFKERTLPLLRHYQAQTGVVVTDIPIGLSTSPQEIVARLSS